MHGQILCHFQLLKLGQHKNPSKIVVRSMLHRQLDLPGLDKQIDSLNHVGRGKPDKLNQKRSGAIQRSVQLHGKRHEIAARCGNLLNDESYLPEKGKIDIKFKIVFQDYIGQCP